jgi:hypothetical protein
MRSASGVTPDLMRDGHAGSAVSAMPRSANAVGRSDDASALVPVVAVFKALYAIQTELALDRLRGQFPSSTMAPLSKV